MFRDLFFVTAAVVFVTLGLFPGSVAGQSKPCDQIERCIRAELDALKSRIIKLEKLENARNVKVCVMKLGEHSIAVPVPASWSPTDCQKLRHRTPADRGNGTVVDKSTVLHVGCIHASDMSISLAPPDSKPSFNCGW